METPENIVAMPKKATDKKPATISMAGVVIVFAIGIAIGYAVFKLWKPKLPPVAAVVATT